MHSHGVPVSAFPNAPATFGDGNTPPPMVGGAPGSEFADTSPAFQQAAASCPANFSNLNVSVLQHAENAWYAAHPAQPESGVVPGT